jgi:hypothetical protein
LRNRKEVGEFEYSGRGKQIEEGYLKTLGEKEKEKEKEKASCRLVAEKGRTKRGGSSDGLEVDEGNETAEEMEDMDLIEEEKAELRKGFKRKNSSDAIEYSDADSN